MPSGPDHELANPIRFAVIVPVWRQARYMASAVQSVLNQEIDCGVGVVIVNDGCPDPDTHRIGQALRDTRPDRVAYLYQPNRGLAAARNAGIRRAFARWPQVEAVFPLDADNVLSPHTLAKLSALLEGRPEAAWASPVLEFFGSEEGEWLVPGPYLLYRQLFANQCDAGSLVRREVFAAGIEYDETMRDGFEDWEFFLRATLAGLRGVQAGRCGFRYRRRPDSMVVAAMRRVAPLEAEIQRRHRKAYEPAALTRCEHVEAPRFALVRCDRGDVLLTSSCDLEPRQLSVADFARSMAAASVTESSPGDHIPPVTVLTTATTIDGLSASGLLPDALFRLQTGLGGGRAAVGLRIGAGSAAGPSALAVRASALARLAGGAVPEPAALLEVDAVGDPLPEAALRAAAATIGAAFPDNGTPLPPLSHASFLERRHIDELQTTFPLSGDGPHRKFDTIVPPAPEPA